MHDDSFDLGYLERIYIWKLSQCGRIIDSHSTRFASLLQNSDIGPTIVQSKDGGKYRALRTERLGEIVSDSDWIQQLRRVIQPVRKEIDEIHNMEKPSMSDLCTSPSALPYNKLRLLLKYLC